MHCLMLQKAPIWRSVCTAVFLTCIFTTRHDRSLWYMYIPVYALWNHICVYIYIHISVYLNTYIPVYIQRKIIIYINRNISLRAMLRAAWILSMLSFTWSMSLAGTLIYRSPNVNLHGGPCLFLLGLGLCVLQAYLTWHYKHVCKEHPCTTTYHFFV